MLYCVGARNEQYEYTGLAHLLEHLMFGGSENAPCFDRSLQEAGGENNAWTSNDITNYYETLPVGNIETAFWLEADRMQNLLLTDKSLETQRSVVIEEFKQRCLNAPYGDVSHYWRSLAYQKHPYRWPVIGKSLSDIEDVSKDVVRDFYHTYYVPNNAILSVVGNLDSDKVFSLAEKWFGDIPCGKLAMHHIVSEPKQTSRRTLRVEKNVPNSLLLRSYRMGGRKDVDYRICDLLSDILSNGRSSRFFRNIYANGSLVSSIDAAITGDLDSGMLQIKAQLLPGVSYKAVEDAIDVELSKLMEGDVSAYEIEKNVNRFESNFLFSNLNNDDRASNLAYYEMLGDADAINAVTAEYGKATPERVTAVSRNLFRPENCSVLYYESQNQKDKI